MPPTFNPGPHPFGLPPIALGGLGPADGAPGRRGGRRAARHAVQHRRRTSASAPCPPSPRDWPGPAGDRSALTVTGEVIVCCGRDEEELETARAAGRWLLAFYASTPAYRPVLEVEGWEELQPELNRLSKSGRWEEMPDMIDDTMLATLAAVGSPREVAADVVDRFGDRVDRVGFYTPYPVADEHARASWSTSSGGAPEGRHQRERPPTASPTTSSPCSRRTPPRPASPGRARRPCDGSRSRWHPGDRVSALVWGIRAPEVVFLHGGGQNAHTWDTVALALDRPLVAVDLPGHGHSDWPGDSRVLDPGHGRGRGRGHRPRWPPRPRRWWGCRSAAIPPSPWPPRHPELVRAAGPGRHHPGRRPARRARTSPPSWPGRRRSPPSTRSSSGPSSSTPPARCPRCGAGCSTTPCSGRTGPGRGATSWAARPAPPGCTWDRWTSAACGTCSSASTVPVLLVRGGCRRWSTTPTRPSSVAAGPTDRVVTVDGAGHSIQGDQPLELARILDGFLAGAS